MSGYTLDDFKVTRPITNAEILAFAESHVNLPVPVAKKYWEQVGSLRDRLKAYIKEHPDYDLVKMLHSGSLSKGTALRRINDIDTALYVKEAVGNDLDNRGLVAWLRSRLREVYPDFDDDQLIANDHCVTVHYKTAGRIDVDVVPVLYEGDPDNKGYLVTNDGKRVLTSISLHKDFVKKRKDQQPQHYAQFVRLAKYWSKLQKDAYKAQGGHFRFKSLMVELICARLADNGLDTSDYTEALRQFFAYIVSTGLKDPIYFTDYYNAAAVDTSGDEIIKIYDPVNPDNNIAGAYTELQRQQIVTEAQKALNAIIIASNATTKGEAVVNWQVILGTPFGGSV